VQMQVVSLHILGYKHLFFSPSCGSLYFIRGNGKFSIQGVMSGRLNADVEKSYSPAFKKG